MLRRAGAEGVAPKWSGLDAMQGGSDLAATEAAWPSGPGTGRATEAASGTSTGGVTDGVSGPGTGGGDAPSTAVGSAPIAGTRLAAENSDAYGKSAEYGHSGGKNPAANTKANNANANNADDNAVVKSLTPRNDKLRGVVRDLGREG